MRLFPTPLLTAVSLVGALCALTVGASHGQIIDDFEQGGFVLQTNPPAIQSDGAVQSALSAFHCIVPDRDVRLVTLDLAQPSVAQLVLGAIDDEVQMVIADGGGRLELRYASASPVDLTFGGVYDRIWAYLSVSVSGARFRVTVEDQTGAQGSAVSPLTIDGPGGYEILLSDVSASGVDVAEVVYLEVILDMPGVGDFHLTEIRMLENPNGAMGFDAVNGPVAGPPYPTESLSFIGFGQAEDGTISPRTQVDIALTAVRDPNTGGQVPVMAESSDAGVVVPGTAAGIIIVNSAPAPVETASFEILVQVMSPNADEIVNRLFPPGPPNTDGSSGFEVWFGVDFQTRGIDVECRGVMHRLMLSLPENSMAMVQNVEVLPPQAGLATFSVLFDLLTPASKAAPSGRVGGNELAKEGETMFELQLTGSENTPDATAAPIGRGNGVILSARPNVMRSHTDIRLGTIRAEAMSLRIVDLRGREIRRLDLAPSLETVRWNGRDGFGREVASGVYFATAVGSADVQPARIVKLD